MLCTYVSLRMVAEGMKLMNIIKFSVYSFYVRQNLTDGFLNPAPNTVIILSGICLLSPTVSSQY